MAKHGGLRVTIEGDLPSEVLERVSAAVKKAALDEVAKLDLLRDYREAPLAESRVAPGHPEPYGLVLVPPGHVHS